jgi:hypothetical protein
VSEDLTAYGLVPISEMTSVLARAARGIPVTGRIGVRAYAMVDAADYDRLASFNWSVDGSGRPRRRAAGGEGYPRMHREVMELEPGDPRHVDHINHDLLDNRRCNLRLCTPALNHQNRLPLEGKTSRFRGVSWDRERGKWKAQATLYYRNTVIGRFETEQEAADAAAAWREVHMPFTVESREAADVRNR